MKYIEWLDKKITDTEKVLSKLEDQKDDEYYSLYDVVESMLKVYQTCKKQYEELPA
jgi:flagellar capping protein FliD